MASTVIGEPSTGSTTSGIEGEPTTQTGAATTPTADATATAVSSNASSLAAPIASSPTAPVTPTAAIISLPVTNIAVTYMTVGPSDAYVRFGRTATPSYLWLDRTPGPDPINGIAVAWGTPSSAPAGDGWTRVDNDLNNAATTPDRAVYLWIKRTGAESPLVDLKVVTSDDPVVGPGFAKLEEILNPQAIPIKDSVKEFLCFKTVASQAKAEAAEYAVGDVVDARDSSNNWCVAQLMSMNDKGEYLVHYKGWSEKWDEWIEKTSKRLAPYRSKTLGKATGWEGDKDAFNMPSKDRAADVFNIMKKWDAIDAKLESKDAKERELVKDEVMFLTANEGYKLILNCLNAIVDDVEMLPIVQGYLQKNLRHFIRSIRRDADPPQAFLESLIKIFKGDAQYTRFYSKYGVKGTETNVGGNYCVRAAVSGPITGDDKTILSSYLVENVNFFGDNGGFEAVAERLNSSTFDDSFFTVALLIKFLAISRTLLSVEYSSTLFGTIKLQELLESRIRKITDQELKTLNKDAINDMVRDVESLLPKGPATSEYIEKINLEIALRLLSAKVLEKRLNGCAELEETIKKVIRKEREGKTPASPDGAAVAAAAAPQVIVPGPLGPLPPVAPQQQAQTGPSAKFLTQEYLIKWIDDNKVVDIFLGPSSHEQIIKRSPGLLKFLASNGALTVDHVEQLWNCSIGKHEGLVRIVYDTLAALAEELSESQLDSLFTRITAVPFAEYTDFVLSFIKNFTINAVKGQRDQVTKWYGLDLFWQMFQDDVKVSPAIATQSASMLKDLLEQNTFESQRAVYLEKCMVGLREGKSVIQCLRVAKTIINMYPAPKPVAQRVATDFSWEDLIAATETRYGLLSLFVADLKRYNAVTRKQLAEYKGDSVKDPVLVGRYPHSLQVDARLDFLQYIITRSPLLVSGDAVHVLWDAFVTTPVVTEDKDRLLEWLTAAVDERPRHQPVFADDTAKTVFVNYLCDAKHLDYTALSKKGYECFETYFCFINYMEASLNTQSRRYIAVTEFASLIGIDSLWSMAATVLDGEVSSLAKKFLTTCYLRLDPKYTPDDKKTVFKTFIERSMGALSVAGRQLAAKADVPSQKRVVNSFLELIENFLARCEAGETVEKPKYSENEAVRACWKGGTRIYDARIMQLNKDGTYVVRYSDGDVDRACPEQFISPLVAKVEEKKPEDDTTSYPKLVLSNDPSYFTLLFELLETSGELAPRVWKLLYRLPTNAELSAKLRQLSARNAEGKINWDELLPSRSAIKLLYSLQIVDQYLSGPIPDGEGSEQAKKEIAEWCQVFLTQGGFAHVYNTLVAADEKTMLSDGPLTQQCMSLMLKLTLAFLSGSPTGTDPVVAHAAIDTSKLVQRLTGVLAACAEAKYDAPAPTQKVAPRAAAASSTAAVAGPQLPDGSAVNAADPDDMEFDGMSLVGPQLPSAADATAAAPGGANAAPVVSNEPAADDLFSNLVVTAGQLIQNMVLAKPDLLNVIYSYAGWKVVLTNGLLKNGNPNLRRFLMLQILQICIKLNKIEVGRPPRTFFLPVLLEVLVDLDSNKTPHCSDFFTLVASLLRASKIEDGSFNPETLGPLLVEKLKAHPLVEKRFEDVDYVLGGLLGLIKELVQRVPTLKEALGNKYGLINELKQCLFDVPKTTGRGAKQVPPPKCKSGRSRTAAYALLSELCQGCDSNRNTVMAHLQSNHAQSHSGGRASHDWQFESKAEEKADSGYVGLKNLGCICYMNALMQQLFMVPKLRQNLLAIDCDTLKEDKKESVTFQLQQIMALLQETEKQYANPDGFCYAFKDFDGKPTNVSIQEDAAGFFSRLIDKIDETLKGTPWLNSFKEVLGGTLSHELIGKGCPHYKERPEEFYAVTLQVQNKKTMADSLKAFVEGEMLEGDNAFRCSQCNKKVDTFKRQSFKKLPPTICFVLKRFELDYQTMQTTKLNDKLEFPVELDLKPYCKESLGLPPRDPAMLAAFAAQQAAAAAAAPAAGATTPAPAPTAPVEEKVEDEKHPDEYYKYVLRGVVVHTGGASHGHYYSFIQERLEGTDQVGRWYEFNDTIVRDFKPDAIAGECYGGMETRGGGNSRYAGMGSSGNTVAGPTTGYEKARSGYMLFYDRVPIAKAADAAASTAIAATSSGAVTAAVTSAATTTAAGGAEEVRSRVAVPPKIFTQIWDQNLTYWRDKAVFDAGYFDFLWQLFGGDEKEAVPSYGVPQIKEGETAVVKPHSGPVVAEAGDHIKLATAFVLNTLTRAFHKEKLVAWLDYLRRLYAGNVNASAWLLQQFITTKWNKEFLLGCNDPEARAQVGGFICTLLSQVTPYEQASYSLPLPEKKESKTGDASDVAVDTRGFCVRYIDQVASFLRSAPDYWKTFDPFFRVLAHFSGLGLAEAQYLERHNYIARLVDFFLGDESPNPAVGDMEVNDKGKRRVMGDNWNGPDTTNYLITLRNLVCSTIPEVVVADSKVALPPTLIKHTDLKNAPMSSVSSSMLMSKQFLPRLCLDAVTRRRGRAVNDILVHQSWENERVSQQLITLIFGGIEAHGYDHQRAYFRVLPALLAIKDSLSSKRIDWIMTSLLNVMKVQQKFWKITDLCIEHLIRIAKKQPDCCSWLTARAASWEWIIVWLNTNPRPPRGHDGTEQTILHKPGKGPAEQSAYQQQMNSHHFPTHVGLAPQAKAAALELIKNGQPLDTDECSDSDVDLQDREFEVGQWVDCMDTAHKWLCAQVVQINQNRVLIHYDGWSDKWNAWYDKSSPRVQAFGKYTTPEQHKARGKKKE